MDHLNSATDDFDFLDDDVSEMDDEMGEFESDDRPEGGFKVIVDKSEVIIFTRDFLIRGKIALVPGARLTDYIVDANPFIAVTDVEVRNMHGRLLLTTPFLNISRGHIVIILPSELAKLAPAQS